MMNKPVRFDGMHYAVVVFFIAIVILKFCGLPVCFLALHGPSDQQQTMAFIIGIMVLVSDLDLDDRGFATLYLSISWLGLLSGW